MTRSALYHGLVTHRRLRPVAHVLRYKIFMLLLDLDEADAIARAPRRWGIPLLGVDRAGVLGFHQADHGDQAPGGLRQWVDRALATAGMAPCPRVEALSMPRVFGYQFNPLTVFFCYDAAGSLVALIHAVRNTFGQRHSYVLPVDATPAPGVAVQQCRKVFHVSPFMDIDLGYRFRVRCPQDTVSLLIHADDAHGALLTAGFVGRRQELTPPAIIAAACGMPLLGLKVLGGIHWEAAKLWWKGMKLRPAPPIARKQATTQAGKLARKQESIAQ